MSDRGTCANSARAEFGLSTRRSKYSFSKLPQSHERICSIYYDTVHHQMKKYPISLRVNISEFMSGSAPGHKWFSRLSHEKSEKCHFPRGIAWGFTVWSSSVFKLFMLEICWRNTHEKKRFKHPISPFITNVKKRQRPLIYENIKTENDILRLLLKHRALAEQRVHFFGPAQGKDQLNCI